MNKKVSTPSHVKCEILKFQARDKEKILKLPEIKKAGHVTKHLESEWQQTSHQHHQKLEDNRTCLKIQSDNST